MICLSWRPIVRIWCTRGLCVVVLWLVECCGSGAIVLLLPVVVCVMVVVVVVCKVLLATLPLVFWSLVVGKWCTCSLRHCRQLCAVLCRVLVLVLKVVVFVVVLVEFVCVHQRLLRAASPRCAVRVQLVLVVVCATLSVVPVWHWLCLQVCVGVTKLQGLHKRLPWCCPAKCKGPSSHLTLSSLVRVP